MLVHSKFRQILRLTSLTPTLLGALAFVLPVPLTAQTNPPPTAPADTSASLQRRIERARALAVVGQDVTAARELEAIRVQTANDPGNPVRGVAGVLLMNLYIEQADYRRAQNLLDDAFARRSAAASANDDSTRTYYAIAGQLINSVRGRLDRYRIFNVPVTGNDMLAEAASDIEGMRTLLDALVQQSRTARGTSGNIGGTTSAANSTDAAALFEDAVGLRLNLARSPTEKTALQHELADARQRLAAVEPRLQPNTTSNTTRSTPTNTPRVATSAPATNIPEPATNTTPPTSSGNPVNTSPANAASTQPEGRSASSARNEDAPRNETARDASNRNGNGSPLDVGSLVERATQRVPPSYPTSARIARVGGVVTVYLVVNEQGSVEEVRRAAGPQMLRRAAEDAARRWRFRPITVEGQPVRATGYISFNFTL